MVIGGSKIQRIQYRMNFLGRKRRVINDAHQWLRRRVPSKKMIMGLKKLQTLLKLEVRCANPSFCSLHFRGESEEESNITAPIVKISPGEKTSQDVQWA